MIDKTEKNMTAEVIGTQGHALEPIDALSTVRACNTTAAATMKAVYCLYKRQGLDDAKSSTRRRRNMVALLWCSLLLLSCDLGSLLDADFCTVLG
jgi:hypothetical protein